MKTILATIATIFVSLTALSVTAEARPHSSQIGHSHTYKSGQTSCGCAIYTKRVIVAYDCYRRPIYRYYSVPTVHRCRSSYRHSSSSYRYTPSRPHYSRTHYSRGSSNHGHRGVTVSGRHSSVRVCR